MVPMENYILKKKLRSASFQKFIICHAYYEDVYLVLIKISPIFRKFPSTLVPFFSQIRNQSYAQQKIFVNLPIFTKFVKFSCMWKCPVLQYHSQKSTTENHDKHKWNVWKKLVWLGLCSYSLAWRDVKEINGVSSV